MADNKDITDQTKQSIRMIKSETETGVNFVKQELKTAKTDVSRAVKDAKKDVNDLVKKETQLIDKVVKDAKKSVSDSVKKEKQLAIDAVKKQQDKSTEAIDRKTTRNLFSFQENIDQVVNNAVIQFDASIEDVVEQAANVIEKTASDVASSIEETTQQSIDSIKKVAEEQKKETNQQPQASNKNSEKTQTPETKPAPDLTTKILQDILSEVKVLRKITEGSIKYDAKSGRYRGAKGRYVKESDVRETGPVREESDADKKRKGLFGKVRQMFVPVKKKTAPVAEGTKQIKEGVAGIATNPLIIAGLLAFLAPTEVLSFIKGFLGEILFGESANAFTQSIGAFVALWAGFKLYDAFKNIITVTKGLWTIGRFLFGNPYLLLALGVIIGFSKIAADYKKKYGLRMERMALEDELKTLQGKTYTDDDAGIQEKAVDNARVQQIQTRIAELGRSNVYSTMDQARGAAIKGDNAVVVAASREVQDAVATIVEYDTAIEKQRAGQSLTQREKDTIETFSTRDQLFADLGFRTPERKAAIEDLVKKARQPAAENRPTVSPTAPSQQASSSSTAAELQQTAVARPAASMQQPGSLTTSTDQPSLQPRQESPTASTDQSSPAGAPTSQSASSVSPSPATTQQTEKPTLETSTPSIGTSINQTSAAVEAGYDETPEDTTTVVSQDATQIPKRANVIDTIPGIIPNRSSFSMYEIFGVVPLPSAYG